MESMSYPGLTWSIVDGNSRLNSGPSLAEAINMVDVESNQSTEFFAINCSHPVEL